MTVEYGMLWYITMVCIIVAIAFSNCVCGGSLLLKAAKSSEFNCSLRMIQSSLCWANLLTST